MKKGFAAVVVLAASLFMSDLFAQTTDDDIQIIQGAWGKQKRELVSIAMELSDADSVKFWPVYDKYEVARKKVGKERIKIIDEYVTSYEKLTAAQVDALVMRLFKNDAAYATLMQQYYALVKKTMGAMQAAKFLHCAHRFLNQGIILLH